MAADDGDYTARMARQLLAEHDVQAEDPIERRVQEARQRYPRARVTWDDDLGDVVIDLSSEAAGNA